MPPNLMPTNGSVSASRPRHTVTVTSFECFIAHAGMRPHSEFIDCSRVRPARRTLHLSMFVPSRPNSAGSTVSDSSAAKPTAEIAPYATDFRKACGNSSSPDRATATIAAENTTVLPAVAVVLATACGTGTPSAISSRKRDTMNRP